MILGIISLFGLVIGVGLASHLFNVLVFGKDDRRTKAEMLGFPLVFGVLVTLLLLGALLFKAIMF